MTVRRRVGGRAQILRAPIVCALLVALLAAGCGVPEDSAVRPLDDAAIPNGLAAPSTSTTSTTIAPTTTVAPTTRPAVSTTLPTVIEVLPSVVIPSDVVWLVFVSGDAYVEVPRPLDQAASLDDVVRLLSEGPQFIDAGRELRSSIEPGDIAGVELVAGVAEVALDRSFRDLPSVEQTRAIVQLVLTLTGRAGVGQVTFRIGQTPLPVPRPDGSFGALTVSRDDFASLLRPVGSPGSTTSVAATGSAIVDAASVSTSSSVPGSTSVAVP